MLSPGRRKRSIPLPENRCLVSTMIAMVTCLCICIIIAFHTHNLLGINFELGNDNSRLFITNKLDKFEHSLNSLMEQLSSADGDDGISGKPSEDDDYVIKAKLTGQIEGSLGAGKKNDYFLAKTPLAELPYHNLSCPHGNLMTFWKKCTVSDHDYISPFELSGPANKYVTFEPDVGGWNNIRMQMELVLVFAAATGRTLVLPPDQPMYLLNAGKGHQKAHNFADFFPFELIKQRVPVITMEEFLAKEAIPGHLRYQHDPNRVAYPPGNKTEFIATERSERLMMWDYLRNVSACPYWKNMKEFVVIPTQPGVNASALAETAPYKKRQAIFAAGRKPVYYDDYWQQQMVVHFISKPELGYRLLEHFYVFIHFQDPAVDRLYKRFVRDFVHYIDIIFCKSALIIHKLLEEGRGRYSSFHIRRGEFQYKEVKIPSAQILANVGQFIPENELIFIATDEKDKNFFTAMRTRFPKIRYLDHYMDIAGLHDINPNFLGMIDQVVCTRGSIFVGTWFSTFSGYITRMRGYMGYDDSSVYFGDKNHRDRYHITELPKFPFYMREWNLSWVDIDY